MSHLVIFYQGHAFLIATEQRWLRTDIAGCNFTLPRISQTVQVINLTEMYSMLFQTQ